MARFPRYRDITKPERCAPAVCSRCGGTGIYTQWHGACFRCGGNGQDPMDREWGFPVSWTDEDIAAWMTARDEKNAAARRRADAKRQAKRDAVWAANLEAFPGLADLDARWADVVADLDTFVVDIFWKAREYALTEKQAAVLLTALEKLDARKATQAARVAAKQAAGHLGAEGDKVTAEVTVVFSQSYEGQYGSRLLLIMEDTEGRTLKTWTTASWAWSAEKGDKVSIKGTVKALETREGKPETLLTRVKGEVHEAAPEAEEVAA